jgi:hypothetical protein
LNIEARAELSDGLLCRWEAQPFYQAQALAL